jgi:hypothetical protein
MGSKSRETIYGASVRAEAERAAEARKQLAVEAWNKRMLAFQGPAQPSPTLGDVLNAGYGYLEVRCLGCDTNQTVALDIVRRPKATPVHELERYIRCRQCSEVRGYAYKAQSSGCAARDQDNGERSAVNVVAGRTIRRQNGTSNKNSTTLSYCLPRHAVERRAFRTRCQSANHCERARCSNPKPRLCLRRSAEG